MLTNGVGIAPYVLLRVASNPTHYLTTLCTGLTAAAHDQSETLEKERHDIAAELIDALYVFVHAQSDRNLRAAALALKRAVYNRRSIPPRFKNIVQSRISENHALHSLLTRWSAIEDSLVTARSNGERALKEEANQVKLELWQIWTKPLLQIAVLVSNPKLFKLFSDIAGRHGEADGKLCKVELSLLAYTLRSITKTKPLSSFGYVCYCFYARGGISDLAVKLNPTSEVKVGVGVARQIVELFCRDRSRFVCTNPAIDIAEDGTYFISKKLENEQVLKGSGSLQIIPSNALLAAVLKALASKSDVCEKCELIDFLAEKLSAPRHLIARIIAKAEQFELLIQACNTDFTREPLHCLDVPPTAVQHLREFDRALCSFDDRRPETFRDGIHAAQRALRSLYEIGGARETTFTQVNIINHKCRVTNPINWDPPEMPILRRDLARIAMILPLFNTQQAWIAEITHFFIERYGVNGIADNPLRLFREFSSESSNKDVLSTFHSTLPAIEASAKLRNELLQELLRKSTYSGSSLVISDEFVETWIKKATPFHPRQLPLSTAFLGNLICNSGNADQFVINKVATGFGMLQASWAAVDEQNRGGVQLQSKIRETLDGMSNDFEFVELIGTFDFDPQATPPITRRSIFYPTDTGVVKREISIPWSLLRVAYNHQLKRVCLLDPGSGKWLLPLQFGPLAPIFYPLPYRFLVALGPCFAPDFALTEMLEAHVPLDKRSEIRSYPEVRYGSIIIARKSWCIPAEALPDTERLTPFQKFCAWRKWAKDLGFPRQVFVKPSLTSELVKKGGQLMVHGLRKPFYVDWDAMASHAMLNRFVRRAVGTLTITEMLPLPSQTHKMQGHAVEAVLEVFSAGISR